MNLDNPPPFGSPKLGGFPPPPPGGAPEVKRGLSGPQPKKGEVMGTVINCDKMVGSQFEEGLAKLKALAEK